MQILVCLQFTKYGFVSMWHVVTANKFGKGVLDVTEFQMQSFSHTRCFLGFLNSHQHLSIFHFWSELHILPSNLHLLSHDICFVNFFDSFISVIMLKTLRLKSCVLFGTHTLLNISLGVLQLATHLFKLTANG